MSRLFKSEKKADKPVPLKHVDYLRPDQRRWSNDLLGVLGLPSKSSQARVLAGAIASAQLVEDNGSAADKITAQQLRATVLAAGTPPWKDAEKAMAATAAKVNLDLLSMPADQRELKPLKGDQKGVNESFWINSRDAAQAEQRSFLCKPAKKGGGAADSGGVMGGEVAREALAGRAAQALAKQTGIDIGMPETHVVTLDASMLPGGAAQDGEKVTCSVQEARHAPKDLRTITDFSKETMSAEQVAGLAIYDSLTLNTDRHGGNVLVDPEGKLVPIDHGESFAEPNATGIGRIKATMGGPHNALLKLPGAHAPMSKEMVKKLKALDADKYASSLKDDNKAVGKQHPDMKDAVTPEAIDTARRAALFVKLGAKHVPPLSPASIQVAMGNAADRLFGAAIDEKTFLKNAKAAIDRIAPQQQAVKEFCTSPDAEYNTLIAQAEALGWDNLFARRTGAPAEVCADPLVLLTIIKQKIPCPKKFTDIEAKLKEIEQAPKSQQLSPDAALEAIAEARQTTIQSVMATMPQSDRATVSSKLIQIANEDKKFLLNSLSLLLANAIGVATKHLQKRVTAIRTTNRADEMVRDGIIRSDYAPVANLTTAEDALVSLRDPVTAARLIDESQAAANDGKFLPYAAENWAADLRLLAEQLIIPANDKDFKAGLAAAGADDPFLVKASLDQLKARNKSGEFIDEPLKVIQAELDELKAGYNIDQTDRSGAHLLVAEDGIQKRDPLLAQKGVTELRVACRNGNFLPKNAGLNQVVDALGVPNDDADLLAMQQALAPPDKTTCGHSLANLKKLAAKDPGAFTGDLTPVLDGFTFDDAGVRQLAALGVQKEELDKLRAAITNPDKEEYAKRLKSLQKRGKEGAFGNGGLQKAQQQLDDLKTKYDIPAKTPALISADNCLISKDAGVALEYIAQLENRAKVGAFAAKGTGS